MSTAAKRRYTVGFEVSTLYVITVLATNEKEALTRAKAIYNLNGLTLFTLSDEGSEESWHVQVEDEEARSCPPSVTR